MKQAKNSQIKSKQRVKAFAEVFTNEREVKAMCDLAPSEIWSNIESTILDPTVGTGNFPVEILARKYSHCKTEKDGLKALASLVAIDIQQDNVDECRERLLNQYIEYFPNASAFAVLCAKNARFDEMKAGGGSAVAYAWFVWQKGFRGVTEVLWI